MSVTLVQASLNRWAAATVLRWVRRFRLRCLLPGVPFAPFLLPFLPLLLLLGLQLVLLRLLRIGFGFGFGIRIGFRIGFGIESFGKVVF